MGEVKGLAEVLAEHASHGVVRGLPACKCKWIGAMRSDSHVAHVEAAVLDWLRERLADEGLQGLLWQAIADARDAHPRLADDAPSDDVADAALAAVAEALGVGEVRG